MDGKASVDDSRRARALIVGDDTNKLHLIAPNAAIVDLTVLSQWSGRQLRTESFEPIARFPARIEHPHRRRPARRRMGSTSPWPPNDPTNTSR